MDENELAPNTGKKIKPTQRILGMVFALITAASVGGCQAPPPSYY